MDNKGYKIKWKNILTIIGTVLVVSFSVVFFKHYILEAERLRDEIEVIRMERALEYGEYQRAVRKADEMEYLHEKLIDERDELNRQLIEIRDLNTELYEELEYYKTH